MSVQDSGFQNGETVGDQYRVLERIGQGGMAEVCLAEHLGSGARVVLKSPLPSKLLEDLRLKDRFLDEIRKMSRLDHPHIVKVHDVLEEWQGRPVAVMHYFAGGSLDARSGVAVDQWLPQIASALDYMHNHTRPIVHRDVKPANIFFDTQDSPYLGDFGIAKVQHGNTLYVRTETGMTLGTPKYMSPEAVHGNRELDGRADQYSLAIVVYEQLAGRIPFDNVDPDSLYQIMNAHVAIAPRRLSEIAAPYSEGTSVALDRALSKESGDRYANCTAFATALLESLRPAPVPVDDPPVAQDPPGDPPPFAPVSEADPVEPVVPATPRRRMLSIFGQRPAVALAIISVVLLTVIGILQAVAWLGNGQPDTNSETLAQPPVARDRTRRNTAAKTDSLASPRPAATSPSSGLPPTAGRNRPARSDSVSSVSSTSSGLVTKRLSPTKTVKLSESTELTLVLISAGEFMMGSPEGESYHSDDEGPAHRVRIRKAFYLGQFEVTQGQYESVMGAGPWIEKSSVELGDDNAASYVNWNDAVEFCKRLSQKEGRTYRLPTEAEWEYACRGGTTTAYHFGDEASVLGEYAWSRKNAYDISDKYAHAVGQKKPNPFGLYDMHGNVYEWCSDWFAKDYYSGSPVDDPTGPTSGSSRVYRGGGWHYYARGCRSADRYFNSPGYRNYYLGFRVALVAPG